jgi:hypothetical protein
MNEPMERGPKVPDIIKPFSFACRAERLAWAGAGPHRPVVGPSGAAQGVGPDANSCEEVALSKSSKFGWNDIPDIPLVDLAWRNRTALNQVPNPLCGVRIVLIIVGVHATTPTALLTTCAGMPAATIA